MPGMTITLLPHTEYYMTIGRIRNSKWQRENSTCKYTKLNRSSKNEIVPTTAVGNMRL